MNETAAKEWLTKAWHHYGSAIILYKAEHYTDVIAIDLHYAVEIILKSFLAYENKKIVKTHNLIELHTYINDYISFDYDELDLLRIISSYHIKGSYPTPDRRLPSMEEIKNVIEFTDQLFYQVCKLLEIDPEDVKK